jgi:hypothetical protein
MAARGVVSFSREHSLQNSKRHAIHGSAAAAFDWLPCHVTIRAAPRPLAFTAACTPRNEALRRNPRLLAFTRLHPIQKTSHGVCSAWCTAPLLAPRRAAHGCTLASPCCSAAGAPRTAARVCARCTVLIVARLHRRAATRRTADRVHRRRGWHHGPSGARFSALEPRRSRAQVQRCRRFVSGCFCARTCAWCRCRTRSARMQTRAQTR